MFAFKLYTIQCCILLSYTPYYAVYMKVLDHAVLIHNVNHTMLFAFKLYIILCLLLSYTPYYAVYF